MEIIINADKETMTVCDRCGKIIDNNHEHWHEVLLVNHSPITEKHPDSSFNKDLCSYCYNELELNLIKTEK